MPSAPVCIMKNEAGSEYLFKKCSRKPLLQGDLSHHGVKEKYQPLYQKLVLNMWNDSRNDTIHGFHLALGLSFYIGCKWAQPGAKPVWWVQRRASVLLNLAINACNSHFFSKESKE